MIAHAAEKVETAALNLYLWPALMQVQVVNLLTSRTNLSSLSTSGHRNHSSTIVLLWSL
jgi:hypothetical protein